ATEGGTAETHAACAVRFARRVLEECIGLRPRFQLAGIDEAPLGRVAIHSGFATIGSFGSPARLEFTAVGPLVEAASVLLAAVQPGSVAVTQPTMMLLGDQVSGELLQEMALPGSRNPVRIHTLDRAAQPRRREVHS